MPNIVMPQPGQSVTEGTVVQWLKHEGDEVALDDILVEVETEKVNVEVPSPFAGTLTRILVAEGETVPVGADLAIIGEADAPARADAPMVRVEAAADRAESSDGAPAHPPDSPATAVPIGGGTAASTNGVPSGDGAATVDSPRAAMPDGGSRSGPATVGAGGADRRTARSAGEAMARYSPAVLQLAAEHRLDLSRITGSGIGGRVTRKDVVAFLERGDAATANGGPIPTRESAPSGSAVGLAEERELAAAVAPAAAPPPAPSATPPPPAPAPSARPAAAPLASVPMPQSATPPSEDEEIIRPSPTRLTIARNMVRSAQTVPVAWMAVEVDVTELMRARERQREAFRQREGIDLTPLSLIAQAVVGALREHPMLNSEWRDDQIVLKKRINLGVAVGVDDGLIVPVIQNADRLSVSGLAHAISDLATRARTRKLRIEDVTGGTFTLDNTGVFGSLVSQPIINPPQAAILSTEAIIKRPMVRDDAIAIRSMMNLCISFDHRIIDGSHVGPFMQDVKRRLEAAE